MAQSSVTRRQVLAAAAIGATQQGVAAAAKAGEGVTICAFSKHFKWTNLREAVATIASLGYDGVDLTVRDNGHVLPDRVEDDLPAAVEIIRNADLQIPMVTSRIRDTESPHAEAIIKTLAALGIRRYRWGGFRYDENRSIPEQLDEIKAAGTRPCGDESAVRRLRHVPHSLRHRAGGCFHVGSLYFAEGPGYGFGLGQLRHRARKPSREDTAGGSIVHGCCCRT